MFEPQLMFIDTLTHKVEVACRQLKVSYEVKMYIRSSCRIPADKHRFKYLTRVHPRRITILKLTGPRCMDAHNDIIAFFGNI